MADELAQDETGGVARDRKADPLCAGDDGGVDADHLAARGDERPAGVARVERRIGLDDIFDHAAGARAERPPDGGDHAGGDGPLEAERVADRRHELAAAQALGVAEVGGGQVARSVGANEREVGVGILAEELRVRGAAFGIG